MGGSFGISRVGGLARLGSTTIWPRAMHKFITFASDADLLALWGAGFLLMAVVALLMERRRLKRARIDGVGWVPWTGVFLACAVVGGGLLAVAIPGIIRG